MLRIVLIIFLAAIVIGCAPSSEITADERQAVLTSTKAFAGDDQFNVEFTAIDGRNIAPRDYLALDPGTYRLTARVPATFTSDQLYRPGNLDDDFVQFDIQLSAGDRFDIYGQWNRNNRAQPYELRIE